MGYIITLTAAAAKRGSNLMFQTANFNHLMIVIPQEYLFRNLKGVAFIMWALGNLAGGGTDWAILQTAPTATFHTTKPGPRSIL